MTRHAKWPGSNIFRDAAVRASALHETLVAGLEARHAAAAVDEVLTTAGPGGMGARVDVETEHGTGLAIGRARHILGAVGHDDLDLVIVGMDVFFHRTRSREKLELGGEHIAE